MFVSQTVMGFLGDREVDFDVLTHRRTATAIGTARAAHVDPKSLAKAVLLHDSDDYLVALVAASQRVNRWAVEEMLDTPPLQFADEADMSYLFRDCLLGAIPALGSAYGLTTVIDDSLLGRSDIYFEGGDHEHLVHLRGEDFARLMRDQPHGVIGV